MEHSKHRRTLYFQVIYVCPFRYSYPQGVHRTTPEVPVGTGDGWAFAQKTVVRVDKGDAFRKQRKWEMAMVRVQGSSKIKFPAIISKSAAAINYLCHTRGNVLDFFRSLQSVQVLKLYRLQLARPGSLTLQGTIGFCADECLLKRMGRSGHILLTINIDFLKQHFTKYKCCQKEEGDADRNHDFVQTRTV